MARPTKLDERTQSLILVGVRLGLTYEDAARAAGICEATFYNWTSRGKKARRGKFLEFFESLTRAKGGAQLTLAKQIHDAAKGGQMLKETRTTTHPDGSVETVVIERQIPADWRAAALILERRYPETWGRRDSLKVDVSWRQELQALGVDPDEAIDYTTELLRAIADRQAGALEGGNRTPRV